MNHFFLGCTVRLITTYWAQLWLSRQRPFSQAFCLVSPSLHGVRNLDLVLGAAKTKKRRTPKRGPYFGLHFQAPFWRPHPHYFLNATPKKNILSRMLVSRFDALTTTFLALGKDLAQGASFAAFFWPYFKIQRQASFSGAITLKPSSFQKFIK